MKIAGVTRVRNEELIISNTLDYYGGICSEGIFLLDEFSEDRTFEIANSHPAVRFAIQTEGFQTDPYERRRFEGWGRQRPHQKALEMSEADWILYFDADERIEFDWNEFSRTLEPSVDALRFRLFDFYITPEDVDLDWSARQWIGPEYRDILMAWRADPEVVFYNREPNLPPRYRVHNAGFSGVVRHYGKAISIQQWEDTCHYYSTFQPEPFKSKWEARKGRAVHEAHSDFGAPLCRWVDRERFAVPLID